MQSKTQGPSGSDRAPSVTSRDLGVISVQDGRLLPGLEEGSINHFYRLRMSTYLTPSLGSCPISAQTQIRDQVHKGGDIDLRGASVISISCMSLPLRHG